MFNYVKANKKTKSITRLPTAILYGGLFLLFNFLLFGQAATSLASTSQQSAFLLSSNTQYTKTHNFSPVKPAPVPLEQENTDENEVSEDFNENFSSLNLALAYDDVFLLSYAIHNRYAQISQSIQNRSVVALFILHHSWKSFL